MSNEERAKNRVKQGRPPGKRRFWSGLQARMALSYIGVSILTALIIEIIGSIIILMFMSNTSLIDSNTLSTVEHKAQIYALVASTKAGSGMLAANTTFQPDQPSSIVLPGADSSEMVTYTPAISHRATEFALLIASDGHILASSYPAQYPTSASLAQILPAQTSLAHTALAGHASTQIVDTPQGRIASAAQPVFNGEKKLIGAVYVQSAPTGSWVGLPQFAGGWLFTIPLWAIILAPPGAVFGIVTTRKLIRRIHRLAATTEKFADGDYTQRIPTTGKDEIGHLEQQFNRMAEQLVASIAQQQQLIEQQVRLEERARIEQELHTARYIQRALLPKDVPQLPCWQLSPFYQPAREVGGDFYDFLPFEDGRIGIVIGDATDKGISAALLMATTCTILRTATQEIVSPAEVLTRVNDLLATSIPTGLFVTCFYALLDPRSGKVLYANAGHDLPYCYRDGNVRELYATGMPLGMMAGIHYDEQEMTLEPGENILFYSDGLVEAHNANRDMFGFPRLKTLLKEHKNGSNEASLIDFLLGELKDFTGDEVEQEDDVTLLTIQRRESILS